jgi:glycerate 2-kinase
MEEIHIANEATYSPVSLTDIMVAAPLVTRILLGATLPGQVIQMAALGVYAASALQDWAARQGVRKIDFLKEFGADVHHLRDMPRALREADIRLLAERVNDGYTPRRIPRGELVVEADRHLTDFIASYTGQRVVTSTEVRDFGLAQLVFPFALGACDVLSGDIAIFKDAGVFEPHVITHELCHRKGYFKELEAQVLAYLALLGSGEPVLVQSALCERLHRNVRVLAEEDDERFRREVEASGLRPELSEELLALRPGPGPISGPISQIMKALYDERMKLTGQNGLSDYDWASRTSSTPPARPARRRARRSPPTRRSRPAPVPETSSPRGRLRAILDAAVAAADPERLVREALRLEGDVLLVRGEPAAVLGPGEGVWLVGAGKASRRMAAAAMGVLGDRVRDGCIAAPRGSAQPLEGIEVWEAGHPTPDVHGVAAAGEALHLAHRATPGELVLCLLSGGASALWAAPPDGVSLAALRAVTRALLLAGAPIAELNTVRKHLSRIAGGQLARAAAPTPILTLAISDVIGVPPDVIGSGPTLPDPTGYAGAREILQARSIHAPPAVMHHLQRGLAGELPETVKPGELTSPAPFHLLASVRDALRAAALAAEGLGYRAEIVSDALEGEASQVGGAIARAALRARDAGHGPVALLWGGETTVTVRGDGRGGRNQELALAAALALEGEGGLLVASMGTDGVDGPTDAAGGIADGSTTARGRAAGLDPRASLARNDAHTFLHAAGDLIVTGPTGTNVNDVMVGLIEL